MFSSWLADIYAPLQLIAIVLAALTFFVGTALVFSGIEVNKIQKKENEEQVEKLRELDKQVADARTAQAEAELQLANVKKRQNPRQLKVGEFAAELGKYPATEVEILFQPNDNEANQLAMQLFMGVMSAWPNSKVPKSYPRPIPDTAVRSDLIGVPQAVLNGMGPAMRVGAQPFGVTVLANSPPSGDDAPHRPLCNAIKAGGLGVASATDSGMPDGLLLVVVGEKP